MRGGIQLCAEDGMVPRFDEPSSLAFVNRIGKYGVSDTKYPDQTIDHSVTLPRYFDCLEKRMKKGVYLVWIIQTFNTTRCGPAERKPRQD